MNKIIQIRGCGAVGKTTCVRNFMLKHNVNELKTIDINGIKSDITVNADMSIIVLGRYDKKTGGCDRYKGKDHVLSAIDYVEKKFSPSILIFEGFVLGKTFTFAGIIYSYCKRKNIKYIPIVLNDDFDRIMERMYKRNDGKAINVKAMKQTHKDVLVAYAKMVSAGIEPVLADISKYDEGNSWEIIEQQIK